MFVGVARLAWHCLDSALARDFLPGWVGRLLLEMPATRSCLLLSRGGRGPFYSRLAWSCVCGSIYVLGGVGALGNYLADLGLGSAGFCGWRAAFGCWHPAG